MKKICKAAALFGVILVFLTGCQDKNEITATGYHRYFINDEETGLITEDYEPESENTEERIQELADMIQEGQAEKEYKSLIPSSVKFNSYTFKDGVVTVDLGDGYNQLEKTTEILVRAGIVKSFVQLPEVKGVQIMVNGQPAQDKDGNLYGQMDSDTFVENEGKNINSYLFTTLDLFFTNETGDKLKKEPVKVYYSSNVPLEKVVVQQLIKGPRQGGYYPTLDSRIKIIGVSISDDICYVNLDQTFLDQTLTVQEKIPIYSIVNSLIDACKVDKVQISVNGETKSTFRESIDLEQFFRKDYSLLEGGEE